MFAALVLLQDQRGNPASCSESKSLSRRQGLVELGNDTNIPNQAENGISGSSSLAGTVQIGLDRWMVLSSLISAPPPPPSALSTAICQTATPSVVSVFLFLNEMTRVDVRRLETDREKRFRARLRLARIGPALSRKRWLVEPLGMQRRCAKDLAVSRYQQIN